MNGPPQFVQCERGTAAIEFGVVAILLIVVTIGIIEVGRALFMTNELGHAADRAARAVMLQFDITEADLTEVVRDERFLTGLVPENVIVEIDAGGPAFRRVKLSYPFTPMVSGLTLDVVILSADRRVAR